MEPEALLMEFIRGRDRLNHLAQGVVGFPVYGPVTAMRSSLKNGELGFFRTISWFFIHHFEAGLVSVRFLVSLFDSYGIDKDHQKRQHKETIASLRTELQHYMAAESEADEHTQNVCLLWYLSACGTRVPITKGHWESCLTQILSEGINFLADLEDCLRCLEKEENAETIIETWKFRVSRDHRPHEYDAVIQQVVGDIGREELDVAAFRSRHFSRWQTEIKNLADNYDFYLEARRLIEGSILMETQERLPITGTDVMEAFFLKPGPTVGEYLQRALFLYRKIPCGKDELIERLRKEPG